MNLENININEDIEIDDGTNKSIISEEQEDVSKASDVWKYFTKDINYKQNKKAKCNHCGITYTCTAGATTNLKKHIKSKHSSSEKMQEMSIKDILKAVPKWKYNNDEMLKCLVKWIIVNQHSFTIVEEPAFADLIYALQPDAKLISADTVKRKIMDLYESNINKVKESFKNITGKISFTIDIWTSPSAKSFLSLTAHYIDDDWKLNNVLVDFIQIFGKHMGENIKNAFMLGINKLSIQNKIMGITTDNASNNLTFVDALAKENNSFQKDNHFRCFAHVINLCVQDALKELDDKLSRLRTLLNKIHHSPQRQEKLSFNCELHGINNLKVVLDVSTRWNSTFDMINRALYLKEALNSLALSEKDLKNFIITDDEWSELEKVKLFLEKFKEITVLMSGSLYPTLSMLIPLYNALIDHTEDYISEGEEENEGEDGNESEDEIGNDNEESTIKKAAMNCRVKLLHYYNKTNDACIIVTILDPRLKMEYYNDEIFLNVYNTTYSNSNSSSTLNNSLNNEYKNSITSKVFKRKRTQEIDEFQAYFLSPVCDESVDPLQWWKINQSQFPRLAKMAMDYLAIPSTSVPSEECFSISKNLITDKRNKLAGKTIRSCMCLKSWISGSLSDLFE
ncbi:zinc finger BED domain-containing protein RICESLEEPER 2-like [Rhizophagus clarus]|uniref:Zinc finger BED domain-containing protein RICESLEEPER 2-like n=1 Tax=Rhizophagus clarus TaxID=94130 RepID=A0A8H3L5R9_9GLOM|nr:zinc finger BED domain-containing protein RICESLEEPER 2-like [Rhizophagus clarus]